MPGPRVLRSNDNCLVKQIDNNLAPIPILINWSVWKVAFLSWLLSWHIKVGQHYYQEHIVYPKKYAHGFVVLCFVVVMQSFIMNSHEVFIHIHQGCFAGTGAIVRLPQCQWSKPDGYGKISQCITTTKHSKAKTLCIFLGIFCISSKYKFTSNFNCDRQFDSDMGSWISSDFTSQSVANCLSLVTNIKHLYLVSQLSCTWKFSRCAQDLAVKIPLVIEHLIWMD